jgi:hypothetical protein
MRTRIQIPQVHRKQSGIMFEINTMILDNDKTVPSQTNKEQHSLVPRRFPV